MADTTMETGSAKKEAAVLCDTSLENLAKELGDRGLVTAMYLNIPTTTLVHMLLAADIKQQSEQDQALNFLQQWKRMRESAKDRDKISDLERALREAGKLDAADVFADRARDNLELTADCFPQTA